MIWLALAVVGFVAFLWISSSLGRRRSAPIAAEKDWLAQQSVAPLPAPKPVAIELSVPKLPDGVDEAITAALRAGSDPDEIEMPANYHAHDLRVVGESFANDNGSSRQEIIGRTSPGDAAYLVPEPDNPHDADAVRVFVPGRSGMAEQIGYLPRGYEDVVEEVRAGRVAAWFKSKRQADNGLWGATLYLVRRE